MTRTEESSHAERQKAAMKMRVERGTERKREFSFFLAFSNLSTLYFIKYLFDEDINNNSCSCLFKTEFKV